MPIQDRNLAPGTRLIGTYRKDSVTCLVTAAQDGQVTFLLPDGRSFRSLSAAGSAVMNGISCNGWRFWSREDSPAPAAPQAGAEQPARARASKENRNGERRVIRRVPNQKAVAEGHTRYFCDCCMLAFEWPTAEGAPEACPSGHLAMVANVETTI